MKESTRSPLGLLKRVHWIVWALVAPALIIGGVKLLGGGKLRVPVVGSGAIAAFDGERAPDGVRFDMATSSDEPIAESAARIEAAIGGWPDVIVFGLDEAAFASEDEAQRSEAIDEASRLLRQAENATAVPVFLLPVLDTIDAGDARARLEASRDALRRGPCQARGLRLCVNAASRAEVSDALLAAIEEARGRQRDLRASTQVGR